MKVGDQLKVEECVGLLRSSFLKIEESRATRGAPRGRAKDEAPIGLSNALMSGFAVCHLKMPSLLQYEHERRAGNLHGLYGITRTPSDTRMREMLDEVDPDELRGAFVDIFESIRTKGHLAPFRVLGDRYAVSVDGTEYSTSDSVHGERCLTRCHKDGGVTYHHQMRAASVVKPGVSTVIPLAPEPTCRGDGATKNDCEYVAFGRFLKKFRQDHPKRKMVLLLDSLHARAPTIRDITAWTNQSYLMTAKEGDHPYLFNSIAQLGYEKTFEWTDEKEVRFQCGYVNNRGLNESNQDVRVNFVEFVMQSPGKKQVRFCCITNIPITEENYREIVALGRARWKIENETFNTLKNQGYHYEHNYGHGNNYLKHRHLDAHDARVPGGPIR